jgi:hypothetical protein
MEDEAKVFKSERIVELISVRKSEEEEELIDFDTYNSGLRRYVKNLAQEDEDQKNVKTEPKKKKKVVRSKEMNYKIDFYFPNN